MGARGSGGHGRVGPAKKGAEAALQDTTDDCTPPPGMTEEALTYWSYFAPLQASVGRFTMSSRFALRDYCDLRVERDRVHRELYASKPLIISTVVDGAGNEHPKVQNNPLGTQLLKIQQQLHTMENDLVLSPAAAMRAPAPKANETDDLDAWAGTTGPRIKAVK